MHVFNSERYFLTLRKFTFFASHDSMSKFEELDEEAFNDSSLDTIMSQRCVCALVVVYFPLKMHVYISNSQSSTSVQTSTQARRALPNFVNGAPVPHSKPKRYVHVLSFVCNVHSRDVELNATPRLLWHCLHLRAHR